jgi:DNA repair protein RecO (recombination protein O)
MGAPVVSTGDSNDSRQRVQLQPAFLLHQRPYRETGRILEFFTRDFGRITLFARGTRSGKSGLNALLQPFNQLLVSWSARGDAGTFAGAEAKGALALMRPARLLSGLYLNELMLAATTRHDSHADLFDLYADTIEALRNDDSEARALRLFEKRLLDVLGYGLSLETEMQTGRPIESTCAYRYRSDAGFVRVDGVAEGSLIFSGASLLSLAHEELADPASRVDARRLLRAALDHCLEGRRLHSREILIELRRLQAASAAADERHEAGAG